jgi:hypothetical protein
VAPPRDGFGAHEADGVVTSKLLELGEAAMEVVGGRPGLVAAFSKTAEGLAQPPVLDAVRGQLDLEVLALELRIAAGAGEAPDVGDQIYPRALRECDEILHGYGRVPERVHHASTSWMDGPATSVSSP